ncbi:amidohydrolase family protein [Roseomonas gilardii]|uniref:amidohydrolase family protein n=1 Tax=Roseomonas gilardii TaxID=257708 RepID=UPI0004846101|nr:amidohydrolase family protein [Roseomonas gilardii]
MVTKVAWSSGVSAPLSAIPSGATDCHFHVYDARTATRPGTPHHPDALEADYFALQRRLGLSRGVLVQPSAYGTDNARHLQALETLGKERFRMVAVVEPDVADATLRALDANGVRGIRFNLAMPGVLESDDLEPLGRRIEALGWHLQVNAPETRLVALETVLSRLPCRLVLDHLGHIPHPGGLGSEGFGVVRRLLDGGRTWIKLSGPYIRSRVGPPDYSDAGSVAAAFARAAPERVLWGSDWPHPTQPAASKPDDARLLDLAMEWAQTADARWQMLVGNPAMLYGFEPPDR